MPSPATVVSIIKGLIEAYRFLSRDGDSIFKLETSEHGRVVFKRTNVYLPNFPWASRPYDTVTVVAGRRFSGKDSALGKLRLFFEAGTNIGQKDLLDQIKMLFVQNLTEDQYTQQLFLLESTTYTERWEYNPASGGTQRIYQPFYHLKMILGIDDTTFSFPDLCPQIAAASTGHCGDRAVQIRDLLAKMRPDRAWNVIVSHTQGAENWGYSVSSGQYHLKTEWIDGYNYVVFDSPDRTGTKVAKKDFERQLDHASSRLMPGGADCPKRALELTGWLVKNFAGARFCALVKRAPGGYDNWGYVNASVDDLGYHRWEKDYCYAAWRVA